MTSTECPSLLLSLPPQKPPVAVIAGPTASGKSAVAMALANALIAAGRQALVINADASQVYRDIPILSAAPSSTDLAQVPHALVGHIDGAENCNAARWAQEARQALWHAIANDTMPIIVGGSGLYIATLLNGIAPVPPIPEATRGIVRAMPAREAHAALVALDPGRAAALPPTDTTRVQRALEVVLATGRTLGSWQGEPRVGGVATFTAIQTLRLLPPRDALYARCDARLASMVTGGAVTEVAALLARRLSTDLPVMRAIGVPQLAAHLRGETTLQAAVASAQLATRQYAKRQMTWWRHRRLGDWNICSNELCNEMMSDIVIKLRQTLLT